MNPNEYRGNIYKGGYVGKALHIDLTKGKYEINKLRPDLVSMYVGGRGFTSRLQYEETGPETGPLRPNNVLIFATGPLTGTVPSGSRFTVGAKSPLTGILGDSNCGGNWGPELKFAGFDMLIIKGASKKPVYLWINENDIEIRDAKNIWGKDVYEADQAVIEEIGCKGAKVATIGPAGENLVKYACIMCETDSAAGRTGMGAVMGSKRLKAIAVRGNSDLQIAYPSKFFEAATEVMKAMESDPLCSISAPKLGTPMFISVGNEMGCLATRNWQTGVFEGANKISGEFLREKYLVKASACFGCPTRCRRTLIISDGPFVGTRLTKAELFPIVSFGSKCGNDDLSSVLKAYELCNKLGLDAGTTGQCIAFSIECYQRRLITLQDTKGIRLDWGDHQSMYRLIDMIAFRKGFGNLLAEGMKSVTKRIKGSERYAIHYKGLDPDLVDPRVRQVYCIRHVVSSIGGTHLRGLGIGTIGGVSLDSLPLDQSMRIVLFNEITNTLTDIMGVCKLNYGMWSSSKSDVEIKSRVGLVKLYNAATGMDLDVNQLEIVAERILNIERAYNAKLGLTRKDDTMPERFLKEPMPEGPGKGRVYDKLETYLDKYYELRKWNIETGIPTREKLAELELDSVADELQL